MAQMECQEHLTRTHRSVEEQMFYPILLSWGKEEWSRFTVTSLQKEGLEGWVLKTQLSQEMEEMATPFSSSDASRR